MDAMKPTSLPYHDPQTTTILSLLAFLLALHVSFNLFKVAYVALLGPLVTGALFGTPLAGATLLPSSFQESVIILGYLGLILMIYEAGLDTDLGLLRAKYKTFLAVAATGIIMPIGLSLALRTICDAPWVAAVASGISLSSTSLGTTIGVLANVKKDWGVEGTKTVLLGAAMLDDVVGLVGVGVVKGLAADSGVQVARVVRPVAASIGLVGFVVVATWMVSLAERKGWTKFSGGWGRERALAWHGGILVGLIAIAGYAGSSVLFAAFLAGASISWWESRILPGTKAGLLAFDKYFRKLLDYLLIPFFFASIGFSIPLRQMFSAPVVWKGVVYTSMMFFAKFTTGIWLLYPHRGSAPQSAETIDDNASNSPHAAEVVLSPFFSPLLVGLAMVARGEIGFVIVGVADAGGVYIGSRETYLVTIWAIVLCTLLGPLGVGGLIGIENRARHHRDA